MLYSSYTGLVICCRHTYNGILTFMSRVVNDHQSPKPAAVFIQFLYCKTSYRKLVESTNLLSLT